MKTYPLICLLFCGFLTAHSDAGSLSHAAVYAAGSTAAFQGNPNVTITAISASITLSRTSCSTPCFVQVSGSATTATGTSRPFEDLEYHTDFGDPRGMETFTQPLSANLLSYAPVAVNADTAQYGPEAVYVYRNPGTYIVTMYVRGANGSGYTTATATQTITVGAFNASGGEYWFAPQSGNDANSGKSPARPKQSLSALNHLIANNVAIHIKAGENWSTGSLGITATPARCSTLTGLRINTYGTGPNPQVHVSAATSALGAFTITDGGGNPGRCSTADVVVSNIDFYADNGSNISAVINVTTVSTASTASLSDIYFDHVNIISNNGATEALFMQFRSTNITNARGGFWGGSASMSVAANAVGIYSMPRDWGFIVGMSLQGMGTDKIHDHNVYGQTQNHSLYRYITFQVSSNYNFNLGNHYYCSNDPTGCGQIDYAQFQVVSDNYMTGAQRAWQLTNGDANCTRPNDESGGTQLYNAVIQRNAITGLLGQNALIYPVCARTLTIRDNLFWNNNAGGSTIAWPTAAINSFYIYRDRIYIPAGAAYSNPYTMAVPSAYDAYPVQQITNNLLDMEGWGDAIETYAGGLQSTRSIVDKNRWYAPNAGANVFCIAAFPGATKCTKSTFATWQRLGFDASGSAANPGFVNPSMGNFNQ